MNRPCPKCGAQLEPQTVRCSCGHEMPEAHGVRCADPDSPVCGVCAKEIQLMDQRCPHCGIEGYPALRPRKGKTSKGAPTD